MAGGKWLPAALVSACLGSLTLGQNAAAAVLTPASPSVVAGSSITLTLNDTVASNTGVGGVDLVIVFSQSLLTVTSIADGTLLPGWNILFNAGNGLLSISECNTCNDAEGTGSVVAITFTAVATAPTTQTQVGVLPGPDSVGVAGEYQILAVSDMIGITAAPTGPTPIPEPGTVALLLAPLLAAAGRKRRDRC